MVVSRLLFICIASTSQSFAQPFQMYEDFIWGDAYGLKFMKTGPSNDMFPAECGWWGYAGGSDESVSGLVSTRVPSRNAMAIQPTTGMETQNIEFHFCEAVPIAAAQVFEHNASHSILKAALQYHTDAGWTQVSTGYNMGSLWYLPNQAGGYHNRWRIHDWQSDGATQRIDGVELQMFSYQQAPPFEGCVDQGVGWHTTASDQLCAHHCAEYNYFSRKAGASNNCQCLTDCESAYNTGMTTGITSYVILHEDAPPGYTHLKRSCVSGDLVNTEIASYPVKTVHECSIYCDSLDTCAAFVYGVNYNGGGTTYYVRDCYLYSIRNAEGCDGSVENTDLFVKARFDLEAGHTCRPDYHPVTSSWQDCREAGMILKFSGDSLAHADYTYPWGATRPEGCFLGGNGRLHFNTGVGGKSDADDWILCERTTTTTTTSTSSTPISTSSTSTTPMAAAGSSSSTTSSTLATTTTPGPVEIIECALVLDVPSAAEFVEDPDVKTMLTIAVAQLLEVIDSWIHNLTCTLIEERRLSFLQRLEDADSGALTYGGIRRLMDVTTKSGVKVNFEVVVPANGGPGEVTATIVKDRFDAKSVEEASDVINQVIKSGVLGSKNYEVRIVAKKVSIKTDAPSTTASESSSENDTLKIVIIGLLSASMCTVFFTFVMCWYAKSHTRRAGEIGNDTWESLLFSRVHLLTPPRAISEECRESLCRSLSMLLDSSSPDVVVVYSAGQREEDALGTGPGLFFAAAAIQALHEHKVPCFCASKNEKKEEARITDLLSHSDSSCKMLVVVETSSLYACRNCLTQIYNAMTLGVTVMRLRFEDQLPDKCDWWSGLDEIDLVEMRKKVQEEFKLALVMPDPPEIVQSATAFLDVFALDIVRRLTSEAYVDLQVSAFSKSVEDTLKLQQLDATEQKRLEEIPLKSEKTEKQNAFAAFRSRTRELLIGSKSTNPAKSQSASSRPRSRAPESSEDSQSTRSGKKTSKRPASDDIQPSKSVKSSGSKTSSRRPKSLDGDEMQPSRSEKRNLNSPGRSDSKDKKERRPKAKHASDGDVVGRKGGPSMDMSSSSLGSSSESRKEKKKAITAPTKMVEQ